MEKDSVFKNIKSLDNIIIRAVLIKDNEEEMLIKNRFTPTQMLIMEYMIENEEKKIKQSNLESVLNLSRATVSSVLQTMEKNKLIDRIIDPLDTRGKILSLSKEAKSFFTKGKEKFALVEKKALKGIDDKEVEICKKVLNQMKENLS